jgi:hypothetical protein
MRGLGVPLPVLPINTPDDIELSLYTPLNCPDAVTIMLPPTVTLPEIDAALVYLLNVGFPYLLFKYL